MPWWFSLAHVDIILGTGTMSSAKHAILTSKSTWRHLMRGIGVSKAIELTRYKIRSLGSHAVSYISSSIGTLGEAPMTILCHL